jgi:HAD superfamily hydrolase (TIGR01509 family)
MAERDRVFLAAVPERLAPLPGLFRLLDELEARGIPRAVATSGHRHYAQLALRTLGVADRFQALATGDEVARGKPAPDIFLLAAERLGVQPTGCLVLEDSHLGVAAAKAAGMRAVAVPNPRIPAAQFSEADYVFDSLVAVHEKLDELLV